MAVEFDLPEGFQTPEDVEPGQSFDAVASLKLTADGRATLIAVDGIPLQGVDKSEAEQPGAQGGQGTPTNGQDAAKTDGYKSFLDAMG